MIGQEIEDIYSRLFDIGSFDKLNYI